MFSTELPHITDIKELDLVLLTLANTTELLLFGLMQMQSEVEGLALAQGEERKPLLVISNRLQAMSFFAQSISELSEHGVQLCHDKASEKTLDITTPFESTDKTVLAGSRINPILQPTIKQTLNEASSTASLVATSLHHYAKELQQDSFNSSTLAGIKNTLATLLPIFIICYTTASEAPDNHTVHNVTLGHNDE